MYYVYMGGTKYKIVTKFYRDCRGVTFSNPKGQVSFGSNGNQTCGTHSLSAIRRSIRDVSWICKDSTKPCNPQNMSAVGEGVEEHIYETIIDISQAPFKSNLGKQSCSEAFFTFSQCCRNAAITTGPAGDNFVVGCTINFGNISKTKKGTNNSPIFSNIPIIYACCNNPLYIAPGVLDTADKDSIAYHLVHGMTSVANASVSYRAPFTFKNPLTPFCIPQSTITCKHNTRTDPPRGFFFDSTTGDIVLTPTKCDEVGIVVIEAREYRKDTSGNMLLMGTTRRDMQLIVKSDCGLNRAPELKGGNNFKVCEGKKLCFTINVTDYTLGNQKPDTVTLTWNTDAIEAQVSAVDSNAREKEIKFCWTPPIGSSKHTPYLFSLTATDNHCPTPMVQSRTYKIFVQECDPVSVQSVNRFLSFSLYPNPANHSVKINHDFDWLSIVDVTGRVVYSQKEYSKNTEINTLNWTNGVYQVVGVYNEINGFNVLMVNRE